MRKELGNDDVLYKVNIPKFKMDNQSFDIPGYDNILEKMKSILKINEPGYNIFLIDDYSKEKIDIIKDAVSDALKDRKLYDICYIVYDDEKSPKPLILDKGKGIELKSSLEELQIGYSETIFSFYNASIKEKDIIIKDIQKRKNDKINYLFEIAKQNGFDVKATNNGFAFVPIKNSEDEGELDLGDKEEVLDKISELKSKAQQILDELSNDEQDGVHRIKDIMLKYVTEEMSETKYKCYSCFEKQQGALDYLKYICESIEKNAIDIYSTSYEEDEEPINETIYKYNINILVDNGGDTACPVVFDDDPVSANLIGSIEYESNNGNYVTNVSLIKPGTILYANGGCLILRASDLFSSGSSYNNLKKVLKSGKLKFDYYRGYADFIQLNSFKPQPIDVDFKVILIGDYETYDILYNLDEDFKKIFKVKLEYDSTIESNDNNNKMFYNNIHTIIDKHSLLKFDDSAAKEVFRYFSRKAENRKKYIYDEAEISRIIMLINNNAIRNKKSSIKAQDVTDVLYERDLLEKHILESFTENRTLLKIEDSIVGSINGLSVIDTGYTSFGRPIRITCSCYKGDGNIIDVQKESNLSGNIHNKSINILKGLLNRLFGGYTSLPVDFHLSFEQLYGKIEGDSASVAEVVCMISALSKIPIKQSIAVTGSINQFGEIQPIGGVNEKIEGYYSLCKLKGDIKNKGVLIPSSNIVNIVLKPEVEEAISKGVFHIYSMDTLDDALEVLLDTEKTSGEEVISIALKEMKKYTNRNKS